MISKYRGVTGVAEDVSVLDTVNTALRFHPGTREIILIGRTTVAADMANRISFAAALPVLPASSKSPFGMTFHAPIEGPSRQTLGRLRCFHQRADSG